MNNYTCRRCGHEWSTDGARYWSRCPECHRRTAPRKDRLNKSEKYWTTDREELLMELWYKKSVNQMVEDKDFPDRTEWAIRCKAKNMGLGRNGYTVHQSYLAAVIVKERLDVEAMAFILEGLK